MMQTPLKILIAEDDLALNNQMSELIRRAGYEVDSYYDGESTLLAASKEQHQLMLLDVMLPKNDGISVLGMLRKFSEMPVIMVTAKGAEEERITGLRTGADDYIAKPFNTTELLLRIEALLRRSHRDVKHSNELIQIDDLALDNLSKQVRVNDFDIDLTKHQFNILWQLALYHGEVLSKAYLSQRALNKTLGAYDRGLDMHLSRIRRKLNQVGWQGDRLLTIHGKGYCLR